MSPLELSINFFVALFALIDPVGNVPVFAAATGKATGRQRARLALYIALFALAFLLFFYVTGLALLEFFGISLPAFRIAGGVLLFLLGLDMIRDDFTAAFAEEAEKEEAAGEPGAKPLTPSQSVSAYARRRFERLVVPFAMPLLIGPGAISTVVIFAGEAREASLTTWAYGALAIAAVCVTVWLSFALSGLIGRLLGRIGMTIVVRVLGLILCALAVQFIIGGVADSTRGLIRSSASAPYESK